MLRIPGLLIAATLLVVANANESTAQDWSPPTRQMPPMPQVGELSPAWMSARADWFSGVAGLSGVSPGDLSVAGEPRGGGNAQVVRVTRGPLPIVVWQDRNGDGRADMIEIFRNGSVVLQVIDPEYDGQANVVRRYDAAGQLVREDRL